MSDKPSSRLQILFDAAYQAAKSNERIGVENFPWSTAEERFEANKRAAALINFAYDVADKFRDGLLSRDKAISSLKAQCQGFSEQIYEDAFAHGLFLSR